MKIIKITELCFLGNVFFLLPFKAFTKSVILEKSGLLMYADEKITLNYTSNDSYTGHHGFVLEYYIGGLCVLLFIRLENIFILPETSPLLAKPLLSAYDKEGSLSCHTLYGLGFFAFMAKTVPFLKVALIC